MANTIRQAIARAKVQDQIVELMVKSNVDNVFMSDGVTTLADKLAEMITSIDEKAKTTDVTTEIKAAIAALIDDAPETYDTLKEIADYIALNKSAMEALNAAIGNKVSKEEGKGLSANDFTDALLEKLDGIADNAEENQNAFSSVKVGETTIAAADKTDTIELVAGKNVTITPDEEGKTITISADAEKVTVDDQLSDESENPVQNKVVKAALDKVPKVFVQEEEPEGDYDLWLQIVPEIDGVTQE